MRKVTARLSVSLASLVWAGAAMAQSADTTADKEDENSNADIVVTATKIATNVQDTPIAITAVTSETLQARGLTGTADIGNITPNATFRKSEGIFGPAVSVYLRGIGQTDPQFNGEPSVAYYIDDIYYPFLFGSNFDLLDLDHVEVLRGPQGTLFGRNAIAGAMNIVSKKPSLTTATGYVELTVGAYDRRDLRAGFSVPLTDTLALSASVISKKRTGYQDMVDFSCQMFKNGTPNLAGSFPFQTPETSFAGGRTPKSCVFDHLGGEDTRAMRAMLYYKPTSNFEVQVSGDYTDQNDEIPAEYIFETNYRETYGLQANGTVSEANGQGINRNFLTMADKFSIPGTPFRWDKRFETGDPYKTYDNYCDPFPAGTAIAGNTYYTGSPFRGGKCYGNTTPLKSRGVQGKATVGLTDQIDFTLIGGYRKMDLRFGAASDGTVLNDSMIYHEFHEHHWNGEARLTGQMGFADWVLGGFVYKGTAEHLGQPQGVRAGTQRYQTDLYKPKSYAGYANVVLHPLEGLNVTGGLRYSDDTKFVDFNSIGENTPAGSPTFVAGGTSTIFKINIKDKRWDWKGGLDYKVSPDIMLYASAGSGYRLKGLNVRPSQPGQESEIPGESLISYEVGGKAEFFDRKVKLNLAAFMMDFTSRPGSYSGQEAQLNTATTAKVAGSSTVVPGGPANTSFSNSFYTCRPYNAATDGAANPQAGGATNTFQGVGVACVARTYYYQTSGKIKGFEGELEARPIPGMLVNGSVGYTKYDAADVTRTTVIPKWTASAGAQYEIQAPMLAGTITPRMDAFYTGRIAYSSQNPLYDQPARIVANARLTYKNEPYDMEVSLGATNVFNKFYYYQKTIFRELGLPTNLGQPAAPREWYLSVKKRF